MKPRGTRWATYIADGINGKLVGFGERFGVPWLIYNPILFRKFHKMGLRDAPGVISALTTHFPDASKLADVGSGSGAFAAEAMRRGKNVIACEHNLHGRKMAIRQGVNCVPFDLTKHPPTDFPGMVDLAYCLEVAEHLPPLLGEALVAFMAALAPVVVFTAAQPGQGGQGHINEQPKAYWIERFAAKHMRYDVATSLALADSFRQNKVEGQWFVNNAIVLRAT